MTEVIATTETADDEPAYERLPFPQRGARRRDLTAAVTEFYTDEVAALDENRPDDWLEMLAAGFIYQVPVPLLREDPALPRHSDRAMLYEATKHIMSMKLGRVGKHYAWSDRPGASIRHIVGGVRVHETSRDGELRVDSNVVAFWNRGIEESTVISAGRQDVLRHLGGERFQLLRRRVLLDAEVATYQQLSIIL
ncbi:aromatic-ring-hydroxylating dioxygenase subunit beta [Micromonospora sp. WMMD712]|uniref:aromatic-ring-hydroxylating dioxygenase subunit beta n=1 Tax=Micromonospora sp. WMMD712 TaxID=3016096 RepID=UPI00249C92B0|nr:aromatic-ring-hydroxylating dioxygenase subunit beta [Micromonospora sp. WMMD712]WFE60216.1 aromatic-ring-hydroxylating dioxygenase subunit beta [Micromonospora sp. WMMD712]